MLILHLIKYDLPSPYKPHNGDERSEIASHGEQRLEMLMVSYLKVSAGPMLASLLREPVTCYARALRDFQIGRYECICNPIAQKKGRHAHRWYH